MNYSPLWTCGSTSMGRTSESRYGRAGPRPWDEQVRYFGRTVGSRFVRLLWNRYYWRRAVVERSGEKLDNDHRKVERGIILA